MDGVESDSYSQIFFPVSGSSATMRLYGEDKYNMPSTTNGVACDARRRGGQVIVPVIVMRGLKVPFELPCSGIQGHQRRTIQVRPFPASAVEIRRRRTQGYEQHPALHIHRHEAPYVRARPVDPLALLPDIMVLLARPRHGVKCPD